MITFCPGKPLQINSTSAADSQTLQRLFSDNNSISLPYFIDLQNKRWILTITFHDCCLTHGLWNTAFEPPRGKSNKITAPSEDSDQHGHPPSVIRVFAVRSVGSSGPKLSSCGQRRHWSDWADEYCTDIIRLGGWVFAGRTGHFVSFVMRRFILWLLPNKWTASSEFGTYRLCEQRRFRRACASAQSRQNLRCSLIQAVNQEEPSDRKSDPWPLWMAGHAQLKFVMTECSKTQIRLAGLI